ncbi:unnamed protein product [Dicrocoelium dendriticum]|nr:unnamed protein product [Dicrocoelium dendriticum]
MYALRTTGLASELNLSVWLPKMQQKLVHIAAKRGCAVCAALVERTAKSPQSAQLHVLPMVCNLSNRLAPSIVQLNIGLNRLLPGGLQTPGVKLERSHGSIRIYGAAYSEHSSSSELKTFITQLRPKRVQPTVWNKGLNAQEYINGWLHSN